MGGDEGEQGDQGHTEVQECKKEESRAYSAQGMSQEALDAGDRAKISHRQWKGEMAGAHRGPECWKEGVTTNSPTSDLGFGGVPMALVSVLNLETRSFKQKSVLQQQVKEKKVMTVPPADTDVICP